jgi:hypothetical protein
MRVFEMACLQTLDTDGEHTLYSPSLFLMNSSVPYEFYEDLAEEAKDDKKTITQRYMSEMSLNDNFYLERRVERVPYVIVQGVINLTENELGFVVDSFLPFEPEEYTSVFLNSVEKNDIANILQPLKDWLDKYDLTTWNALRRIEKT